MSLNGARMSCFALQVHSFYAVYLPADIHDTFTEAEGNSEMQYYISMSIMLNV